MLIAISGSQGSGKSTILKHLEEDINTRNQFKFVSRKTSRSILSDWGVTLAEVNADLDLTTRFQDETLRRKVADESGLDNARSGWGRPHICFTERTYADLFGYALITLGKNNKYSDWLNEYYKKCMQHTQIYASVYYLSAGRFAVEHDGVRGSNTHYSRMVDGTMLDLTKQMVHSSRLTIVDTPDLASRLNMIASQSTSL